MECLLYINNRVPGDIDEVNTLRMRYDRSDEPNDISDPHTPSSLLKLWFRELESPLIPDEFYLECISNSHNEQQCVALAESLPKLNRTVFFCLIRFLQVRGTWVHDGRRSDVPSCLNVS